MAQVQGEEIYLSHSGQEVDDNIEEVVAARGDSASLSARLADIVNDFEADQQRQDNEIGTKATIEDIYGIGTSIPANSDLNDYRTGGNFYAVNSSVANSISNIPVSGSGFRLIVHTMNTSTYCRQEFYKVNQPEFMYVRTYNGTWSAWYKFTGEAVQTASAQSAPASLMQAGRLDAAEQTATEPGEEANA